MTIGRVDFGRQRPFALEFELPVRRSLPNALQRQGFPRNRCIDGKRRSVRTLGRRKCSGNLDAQAARVIVSSEFVGLNRRRRVFDQPSSALFTLNQAADICAAACE